MRSVKVVCIISAIALIGISFSSFMQKPVTQAETGEELFLMYCGTCHMLPEPSSLPTEVWKSRVLPVMASRLGIRYPGFNPLKGLSPEEIDIISRNGILPRNPAMDEEAWRKLSGYILQSSPDHLPLDQKRLDRNKPLRQFVRKDLSLQHQTPSMITGLKYDDRSKTLWIGDDYQTVSAWQWNKGITRTLHTQSSVVDFTFYQHDTFFTEIGRVLPTELSKGSYTVLKHDTVEVLIDSLHRPVNAKMDDLNNDGSSEVIVCNFGNKVGALSLYTRGAGSQAYTGRTLLNMPGAISCYVRDMDGDGQKDIVALFAQGDESVYVFYQKGNLEFKAKRVLRFPPQFGTTDLVLTDFNRDGLVDILTVHGDNADHSPVLKDFHGVRIHVNRGNGKFSEKYFYPVYGVTKAVADDFDQDGDVDIVLTAFFPDYDQLIDESFVYLENDDAKNGFHFTAYTHQSEMAVKTLTLEKADIDQDGDMDILLGLFAHTPGQVPEALDKQWKSSRTGLILFLNQLK